MDAVERGASAVYFEFVNRLPAQERTEQPAQPKDVIEMSMRQQDAREILEARARLQDLALCAFAAINQETIFIVFDNLRRKPALRRGRGCRRTKKKYFEQN